MFGPPIQAITGGICIAASLRPRVGCCFPYRVLFVLQRQRLRVRLFFPDPRIPVLRVRLSFVLSLAEIGWACVSVCKYSVVKV